MITLSHVEFVPGDVLIQGLTDAESTVEAKIGEKIVPVNEGSFEFTIPAMVAGVYSLPIQLLDASGAQIENETFTITVNDVNGTTVISNPEVAGIMSPEAQALVDLNKSTTQNFIQRYNVSHETDTTQVVVYPGSLTGFGPLSASAHSATKANEFKIMDEAALAANPSAGFTGGRGTGNPADFGRFPERALMKDVRAEFFPKAGDFDSKTLTQYPLGRTGDLLENQVVPVGFTQKDPTTGYSTTTTRGGVNASPIPSTGFTF